MPAGHGYQSVHLVPSYFGTDISSYCRVHFPIIALIYSAFSTSNIPGFFLDIASAYHYIFHSLNGSFFPSTTRMILWAWSSYLSWTITNFQMRVFLNQRQIEIVCLFNSNIESMLVWWYKQASIQRTSCMSLLFGKLSWLNERCNVPTQLI